MLERKIYAGLQKWREEQSKKALCVIGARQTGKTTIIEQFGREYYKNFVEINFVTEPEACRIFSDSLDADTITERISAFKMQRMVPGETLIFLDEIQECPDARTAIKFLVQDGRFDYIESGSELGVRYKEVRSYPVGFEEICPMFPMDFEEFLLANGVQKSTMDLLHQCFVQGNPVPDVIHDRLLKLFYTYIVVGGMPAAVQTYVDTHDIERVVRMQRDILDLYRQDISRYALGADKVRIRAIFDSIPAQLATKNRRFYLQVIDKNGRQNRYENAFLWLSDAGVALPSYNVTQPQLPLKLNEKRSIFKLFQNDTGLLCAACMSNIQFGLLTGDVEINMGSILENVFAQSLTSAGFALHYYDSKKHGELDFVVQNGMNIDLIEVKSGGDYGRHNALNHVLAVDEWEFRDAYVFCRDNVRVEERIRYMPWYMILFYQPEQMPEDLIYKVDLDVF